MLEAAAAGMPMIATRVGGIPEIFGTLADRLVPPGDVAALRYRIEAFLNAPAAFQIEAAKLREDVGQRFTVAGMTEAILAFYRECRGTIADAA